MLPNIELDRVNLPLLEIEALFHLEILLKISFVLQSSTVITFIPTVTGLLRLTVRPEAYTTPKKLLVLGHFAEKKRRVGCVN